MTIPVETFSFKETLIEIRSDVKELKQDFEQFKDDSMEFRTTVVLKSDFNLWQEARRTTRRWAVATMVSIIATAVMAVTLVVQLTT